MSLFGDNKISSDFIKPKSSIYGICKAPLFRRFSAFLLDLIITIIVAVGVAYLLTSTSEYEELSDKLDQYYEQYGISYYDENNNYTVCLYPTITEDQSQEEYEAMILESDCYKAHMAFENDPDAVEVRNKSLRYSIFMISFGLLVGTAVTYLGGPILFKNGQTPGMKISRIGLVTNQSVKVSFTQVFIRWSIGIYVIETMIPVYLFLYIMLFGSNIAVCAMLLLIVLSCDLFVFAGTKNRVFIHDLIAGTVIIDMNEQIIASSLEEYEQNIKRKINNK